MNISDLIEQFIVGQLDDERMVELKRNELANVLGCVPSQINYVISTRFTTERGYIVESRRGGGGYIKITRVKVPAGDELMHVINSVGTSVDAKTVEAILNNLTADGIISPESANIILSACSDKALRIIAGAKDRNVLRADIFKTVLIGLV